MDTSGVVFFDALALFFGLVWVAVVIYLAFAVTRALIEWFVERHTPKPLVDEYGYYSGPWL